MQIARNFIISTLIFAIQMLQISDLGTVLFLFFIFFVVGGGGGGGRGGGDLLVNFIFCNISNVGLMLDNHVLPEMLVYFF